MRRQCRHPTVLIFFFFFCRVLVICHPNGLCQQPWSLGHYKRLREHLRPEGQKARCQKAKGCCWPGQDVWSTVEISEKTIIERPLSWLIARRGSSVVYSDIFAIAFIFIIIFLWAVGCGQGWGVAGAGHSLGSHAFFSYASKTKASHSQTILSK